MLIAAMAGAFAGALHVLSGPDHLAAVAPLAAATPGRAWIAGARWGLGHSAGVALVAALAAVTVELIDIDLVAGWSERLVGVTMVGIGLWALHRATARRLHSHHHRHGGVLHAHPHVHGPDGGHATAPRLDAITRAPGVVASAERLAHPSQRTVAAPLATGRHLHSHAALAVGALHGLAGSSHVIAVLPMMALHDAGDQAAFIAAYTVATVAAMALFAGGLGQAARRLGTGEVAQRVLMAGCAVIALGVGGYWLSGW